MTDMTANTSTPASAPAAGSASIDHQVTYVATSALHELVRERTGRTITIRRTLVTTYFDTESLSLHRSGTQLRERGRVGKTKRTTEAKIPTDDGLLRLKGSGATAAVAEMTNGQPVHPVAEQTKERELLIMRGDRSWLAPDFLIALDHATVQVGEAQVERCEIELQLFTSLPWTKQVDGDRVKRFRDFCRTCEADFGLVPTDDNGYQAIPEELLA